MNEFSNTIRHQPDKETSAITESPLFPAGMRPGHKHVIIAGPCSAETE